MNITNIIRRIKLRLWLFSWLVTIGIWSLIYTEFGMKIIKAYLEAEKKRISSNIDDLHK